jgi:hypothetical protein
MRNVIGRDRGLPRLSVSAPGNPLFESGHCGSLLTKVRQRTRNAAHISFVKLVSRGTSETRISETRDALSR